MPSAAGQQSELAGVGLKIQDLSVRFGDREVLQRLNLEIAAAEIVALVGASGCGKSTLLRASAGLQPLHAGSIQFTDRSGHAMLPNCSFVFQDATLLPWRTVWENVALPFELRTDLQSTTPAARTELITNAIEAVRLEQTHWPLFPRQLSGGMRMRTSIARALVTNPSLLLLDEPFAALDDILRNQLNQLLLELWSSRPRTILFVTHNIAEAVMLSHKVAVIANRHVAQVIDNRLAWPRTSEMRTGLEFANMYSTVSNALADHASPATANTRG